MQLQAEKKPTYDYVFIHLGPLHITCAFFSILGKYLAESGASHILNKTHVTERGTLKSFLSGKSYNRCKRSDQLFGAAMEILHVQAFADQYDWDRFKTVVSNEVYTTHTEKTFMNILQTKNWWSTWAVWTIFIENIRRSAWKSSPILVWIFWNATPVSRVYSRRIRLGDFEFFYFFLFAANN